VTDAAIAAVRLRSAADCRLVDRRIAGIGRYGPIAGVRGSASENVAHERRSAGERDRQDEGRGAPSPH
jgi:hypothetical protein